MHVVWRWSITICVLHLFLIICTIWRKLNCLWTDMTPSMVNWMEVWGIPLYILWWILSFYRSIVLAGASLWQHCSLSSLINICYIMNSWSNYGQRIFGVFTFSYILMGLSQINIRYTFGALNPTKCINYFSISTCKLSTSSHSLSQSVTHVILH